MRVKAFHTPMPTSNRRGHSKIFFKSQIRMRLSISIFTVRMINPLNALPDLVVTN